VVTAGNEEEVALVVVAVEVVLPLEEALVDLEPESLVVGGVVGGVV
jgi:hypothetical protein